jgi:hypothetical protein
MKKLLKNVLRKFGLFDTFNLKLSISPQTFVDKLSKKTDDYRPNVFGNFTFNKKEYKGYVTTEKFEIKKRKTFPVSFENYAEAFGEIKINEDKLEILVEVYSIQPYMIVIGFGLTALILTTIAIGLFTIIFTTTTRGIHGFYGGLLMLTFETVFLGLPIMAMRWSVKNLKTDLQDELRNIKD